MYTVIGSSERDCVLVILFQLYGSKAGFLKVIYCGWVNMTPQPSYTGRRTNPILINFV